MTALQFTPVVDIDEIYQRLQTTYKSGKLLPLEYRRKQLYQLARLIQENTKALEDALVADLGRPPVEAIMEGLGIMRTSLGAASSLEEWATPEKPNTEGPYKEWGTAIYPVPKGVVLIISPWNFPFSTCLNPLVGAIAAGCPTVIKPSEHTPACATELARLIPQYLDPDAYVVVNGAVEQTSALLSYRWDHIFFTGSGKIGKIIATAAAQKLTPVTLELGGKSPVIVGEDCDVELAAKRILWGKSLNVGQICVSADHVLVVRSVAPAFREALKKVHATFWPEPPLDPETAWGKIVSPAHEARIRGLLDRTRGEVVLGGQVGEDGKIPLTVVADVKPDDSLMEEEIFGPVLPILEVKSTDEAIEMIAAQPAPLVIYAFSNSEELKQKLLDKTRSGTIVFNDIFTQLRVPNLPFGGFAESGYGAYTGKASFDTFSHRRGFVNVPPSAEATLQSRYRPYTDNQYEAMKSVLNTKIPDA